MPRLELSLYERLVNNSRLGVMLGRSRSMGRARKHVYHNPEEQMAYIGSDHHRTVVGSILEPFKSAIWRFLWRVFKEKCHQEGLAYDDYMMTSEVELRRSPFYEHIWRESTHPYQHLLFYARRRRYHKVNYYARGFYVPEHLRNDVANRTLGEALQNVKEWQDFLYNNYFSDMTPSTVFGIGTRFNILDLFVMRGLFRGDAWDRYFYNESIYDQGEDFEDVVSNPFCVDLDTEDGRRAFEADVNRLISEYPGAVVPEGESFNFSSFYARRAIRYNGDLSRFDTETIADARRQLEENARQVDRMNVVGSPGEGKVGTNTIGIEPSPLVHPPRRTAFMN